MPGFAATKEASRSATGGSNLTGVAARLLMTTFVVDMSHATGESSPPRLPAHSLCGDLAEGPYRVGLVHQENPGIGQVERAAHRSRVEFVNVASKQLHRCPVVAPPSVRRLARFAAFAAAESTEACGCPRRPVCAGH